MSNGASRRAAEQMERDGIRTLKRWTKPRRIGCASYQQPIDNGLCTRPNCKGKARYSTPLGNCCFEHAIAQRSDCQS